MQQLAYKAYGEVTNRTASDKQIEYALFRDITRALQEVASQDTPPPAAWADAIDRNLQLWTLLSTDLLSDQNELDPGMKRSLLIIAESVRRTSYRVLSGSAELKDLVEINETIMGGLSGETSLAAEDASA